MRAKLAAWLRRLAARLDPPRAAVVVPDHDYGFFNDHGYPGEGGS